MEEGIIRYQRTMVYVRPKDTGLDREARMYIRVYSTLPPGTAILWSAYNSSRRTSSTASLATGRSNTPVAVCTVAALILLSF